MRILIVLTYYRPHTSGLTIYAERLAKALVKRGHLVTVMTSQFERNLPGEETVDGVHIVRVPVLFRLSKGVIMPTFGMMANRLVAQHDVVHLHLPQFDAAGVALRGRFGRKPTVVTYHCDLKMPSGALSQLANRAILLMNELAAIFTHRMVTYTKDYAENSQYLRRYTKKLRVISPPVELPEVTQEEIDHFKNKNNPDGRHPIIGMSARFASEKGVEVLLDALPAILRDYPQAQVQFAGAYEHIMGEEDYFKRLIPRINAYEESGNWKFLGNLSSKQIACYYPNLDVLVLPSLNSTESFGLVQIEAMINGVPCVTSNLPGVRQPVIRHGMGKIFSIGESLGLSEAVIEVLKNGSAFQKDSESIRQEYRPDRIAQIYEELFNEIRQDLGHKQSD